MLSSLFVGGHAAAHVHTPKAAPQVASSASFGMMATTADTLPLLGADVSWPQCPPGMGIPERPGYGLPLPDPATRKFVVVGLTNGPGFTPNPCIGDQLKTLRAQKFAISAYSMVTFPNQTQEYKYGRSGPFSTEYRLGRLSNVGYAQGQFNIETLKKHSLCVPGIFIDVEPYPKFPWSNDAKANVAVVEGVLQAYRDAGLRVGFYSNSQWPEVVGNYKTGLPEWRTAGPRTLQDAKNKCNADQSFQGGPPVMAQWWDRERDHNVMCDGAFADMDRWFTTE